jgi:hypothetical protein
MDLAVSKRKRGFPDAFAPAPSRGSLQCVSQPPAAETGQRPRSTSIGSGRQPSKWHNCRHDNARKGCQALPAPATSPRHAARAAAVLPTKTGRVS